MLAAFATLPDWPEKLIIIDIDFPSNWTGRLGQRRLGFKCVDRFFCANKSIWANTPPAGMYVLVMGKVGKNPESIPNLSESDRSRLGIFANFTHH